MSKVDALRAMREAKYARAGAPPDPPGTAKAGGTAKAPGSAPARATTPAVRAGSSAAPAPSAGPEQDTAELCGHRSMGGKSCSRPAGHSEKNHRYAAA